MGCFKMMKGMTPLFFLFCFFILGCENPLGDEDTRDSSFAPGGGGSGSGSNDGTPPGIPSSLNLNTLWTTGSNPANSPSLTWTNPSDDDFERVQVALGTTLGGEEVLPFLNSEESTSHIFRSLSFVECSVIYYPSLKALDSSGNESSTISFTAGFRYDNTPPVAIGTVNIPSNNATSTRTVTANWMASPGSDNCGIDHYEIAIGYDAAADGFDAGDVNNILDWSAVPGGSAVTSYQIQDGVNGFSFSSTFNRQYFTSIRVVDKAGLTSNVTSSSGWYTFHPTQLSNLEIWLDSSATGSLFQDSGCTATPAALVNDPIGCWRDQSGQGNHAIQAGGNQPRIGSTGIHFDGADDLLSVASKNYVATSDISIFVFYEADTQSLAGGSCCRPIVSFATNSTGLFPWLGLTRGNLAPINNLFHGWSGAGLSYIPTSPGDQIIISATHDGTNALWNAFSFGVQRVTNQAIASFTGTPFNVGGDSVNTARRVAGEIYEVVIIEDIVSSTERENMEGYLACKYDARDSLDPSHPFYDLIGANKTGCP